MNDDKLMELLDLATEQYAPPPGKQAVVLNRIIRKQTLDTAESENQIRTQ